ncbi:hypothetical protein C8R46DRAFT_1035773 [Mycena filopes]|nr:hypothetical protein C8R46DRAFT_1035773 [Mycena filopes]
MSSTVYEDRATQLAEHLGLTSPESHLGVRTLTGDEAIFPGHSSPLATAYRTPGTCSTIWKMTRLLFGWRRRPGATINIAAQPTRLEHLLLDLYAPNASSQPPQSELESGFESDFAGPCILCDGSFAMDSTYVLDVTLRYVFLAQCSPVLEQITSLISCHLVVILDDDDLKGPPSPCGP